jgi:hypothetical protein
LKRCNRSRRFSAKFARHTKNCRNYKISKGLNCKSLGTAPMVAGGYCFANSHHSRAWEIATIEAKERGRRGDSIPYLTYRGGASWWPDFAGEVAAVVLPGLCSWAVALGRGGQQGGGRGCRGDGMAAGGRRDCRGRAGPRRAGARGKGVAALVVAAHGLRRPRHAGA